MCQLHDQEREIGEFYGQLNNLLIAVEDAKNFLSAWSSLFIVALWKESGLVL